MVLHMHTMRRKLKTGQAWSFNLNSKYMFFQLDWLISDPCFIKCCREYGLRARWHDFARMSYLYVNMLGCNICAYNNNVRRIICSMIHRPVLYMIILCSPQTSPFQVSSFQPTMLCYFLDSSSRFITSSEIVTADVYTSRCQLLPSRSVVMFIEAHRSSVLTSYKFSCQ